MAPIKRRLFLRCGEARQPEDKQGQDDCETDQSDAGHSFTPFAIDLELRRRQTWRTVRLAETPLQFHDESPTNQAAGIWIGRAKTPRVSRPNVVEWIRNDDCWHLAMPRQKDHYLLHLTGRRDQRPGGADTKAVRDHKRRGTAGWFQCLARRQLADRALEKS